MTRVLCSSTIGLIFGYLSGYNLYFSSPLVKLSIIITLVSLVFIYSGRNDIWAKYVSYVILSFSILFVYGNIIGHDIKQNDIEYSKTINTKVTVRDISVKDSTTIIEAKLVDNSFGFDNIVIYSQEKINLYPDDVLNVSGEIMNNYTILPKHKEIDFRSFDLAKYWKTKNVDGVVMNAKISTTTEIVTNHSLNYFSYKFREIFKSNLNKAMPNEEAGIALAMLLGDESGISSDTNDMYRKAGISHVLVLSGYNLSVIAGVTLIIFSRFSF